MRTARIDKLYVAVRSEGLKFQKQYYKPLVKVSSTFGVVFLRRILHAEIPNSLFWINWSKRDVRLHLLPFLMELITCQSYHSHKFLKKLWNYTIVVKLQLRDISSPLSIINGYWIAHACSIRTRVTLTCAQYSELLVTSILSWSNTAMPLLYTTDLRWRIVRLSIVYQCSSADISQLFNVSSHTVTRYVNLFNTTGDVLPRAHSNGPPRLLGQFEQVILLRLIIDAPGIYLCEIQRKLYDRFSVEVSLATIYRTLKYMGCSDREYSMLHCSNLRNAEVDLWQRYPCMTRPCWSG